VPSAPCDPSISGLVSSKLSHRSVPGAGTPSAGAAAQATPATSADALFASVLQRSDHPTPAQIRQAISTATAAYGGSGCAARVAQAFGEHPETAVARMRWARALTACATPATYLAA
jgi:hypothetical protein